MTRDTSDADTATIARLEAEIAELKAMLAKEKNLPSANGSVAVSTSELRMWESLDALDHGVALFDRDDRLVRCNERYRLPFKDNPEFGPRMSHTKLLDLFLASGLVNTEGLSDAEWHAKMLARWSVPNPDDMVVELKNGEAVHCVDRRDAAGNMICLANNVTPLKEVERKLRAAQNKAEAANEAKSAFLANMSHEIRTPMNGVVGMADLLNETELTEEQRLFVNTIKSSGEALLVIINDVLDFSKIEADRMVLHPEPFDLERLVHDLVLLLQPAARKKGIELAVDYDMFLPAHLIADPGRIRQILTNLMGNAVKFTDEGYVLIRIVGIEMEGGLASIHITVEDTGLGIPEDALDHVFGTFNQVDDAEHRKTSGTGLGLSISQRLVDMMGGEIWVDSEVGVGSCFGFKLTMPIVNDPADAPPTLPEHLKTVMIVDDLEVNRRILEKQLRVMGVDTIECATGFEALEKLDDNVDLVMTDQVMPEMNGVTLAKRIRSSGSKVPIFLLTSSLGGFQSEAKEAGVHTVLQNPVPRKALFAKLKELGASNLSDTIAIPPTKTATKAPNIQRGLAGARQMRVLTAEDNMTNQLVFEKCVRLLNIDLRFAKNGVEALTLYESYRPDLIFMDISMPQVDGRQATAEIRSRETRTGRQVPIVAMTAHSVDEANHSNLTIGMNGCLTKPMRRHQIIDVIKEWQPHETDYLFPDASDASARRA